MLGQRFVGKLYPQRLAQISEGILEQDRSQDLSGIVGHFDLQHLDRTTTAQQISSELAKGDQRLPLGGAEVRQLDPLFVYRDIVLPVNVEEKPRHLGSVSPDVSPCHP